MTEHNIKNKKNGERNRSGDSSLFVNPLYFYSIVQKHY